MPPLTFAPGRLRPTSMRIEPLFAVPAHIFEGETERSATARASDGWDLAPLARYARYACISRQSRRLTRGQVRSLGRRMGPDLHDGQTTHRRSEALQGARTPRTPAAHARAWAAGARSDRLEPPERCALHRFRALRRVGWRPGRGGDRRGARAPDRPGRCARSTRAGRRGWRARPAPGAAEGPSLTRCGAVPVGRPHAGARGRDGRAGARAGARGLLAARHLRSARWAPRRGAPLGGCDPLLGPRRAHDRPLSPGGRRTAGKRHVACEPRRRGERASRRGLARAAGRRAVAARPSDHGRTLASRAAGPRTVRRTGPGSRRTGGRARACRA